MLTLTFMVGALQLLPGLVRVSKWVGRVPHSVMSEITAGAAILIVNSQVGGGTRGHTTEQRSGSARCVPAAVHARPAPSAPSVGADETPRPSPWPAAKGRSDHKRDTGVCTSSPVGHSRQKVHVHADEVAAVHQLTQVDDSAIGRTEDAPHLGHRRRHRNVERRRCFSPCSADRQRLQR